MGSIVYWSLLKRGDSNPRAQAETQIIEAFEQKTGNKVEVEVVPWNELDKKLVTATAANSGPDVPRVDPTRFGLHWQANTHVSLSKYVSGWSQQERDDFPLWNLSEHDGQKMSLPVHLVTWMLYYRTDLFDQLKLQVPKTWAEFGELTKKLTVGNERWGFATGIGRTAQGFEFFYFPLIWSAGGDLLDKSGKAAFGAEPGVKAMQFVGDLVHTYAGMPKEAVGYSYDDCMQAFMSGKIATVIEGSHRYSTINTSDTVKGKFALAELPSWDGQKPAPETVRGWHIAIARPSKKQDTAWQFIEHYASRESQLIQSKVAKEIPVRKSALTDPFYSTPEASQIKAFAQSIEKNGRPQIQTPHWDELNDKLLLAAHSVINKQRTAKEAIEQAASQFNLLV